MLRRISAVYKTQKIVLTKPLYKAEAYLMLYPEAYNYIVEVVVRHADFLGENFLSKFEAAWSNIHSQQGRNDLYNLLLLTTSTDGRRRELIEDNQSHARTAVTVLSIYSAFIMSFFEGKHRKAYDLLYAAESIHQDAKTFIENKENSVWAADDNPGETN